MMKCKHRTGTWVLLSAVLPISSALGGELFVALGGGIGDVTFNTEIAAANDVATNDNFVGEYAIGYRFNTNVLLEGGGTVGMSVDGLLGGDFFTLHDTRVIAGYVFEIGDRFTFVPELGLSFWDLEAQDDAVLFFLGGERGELDESGRDVILRISGEWHFGARLALYASYLKTDADFGDFLYPSVGVKWQF